MEEDSPRVQADEASPEKERPLASFLKSLEDRLGKDPHEEEKRTTCVLQDKEIDLPASVTCLTTKSGGQVFLIGTAHVSQASVEDVVEVISKVRPQNVFVELCFSRAGILWAKPADPAEPQKDFDMKEIIEIFKRQKGASAVLHLIFSIIFKRIMKHINIMPGSEFRAAALEAAKCGATLILGDRPIEVTLRRAWGSLSYWEKLKLIYFIATESSFDITAEEVEKLKNTDIVSELVKEMAEHFPSLVGPIINERDLYLASKLRECTGDVVVGVMGMGHCSGIREHWEDEIDRDASMQVPPSGSWRAFFLKVLAVILTPTVLFVLYYMYLGRTGDS